jgi:GDP-L-fucose synthase
MDVKAKIYVAGHRGLVGSALIRRLQKEGFTNLLTRTHAELDLLNQDAVRKFFAAEQPAYVFLGAAKVGGILGNNNYPAEFIHQNLVIETNIIHAAWQTGVKRLLFLGSSCIYPRECPQPMREEYLLSGPLEPTNRPYAVAKIAGIEMCWAYNRQYDTRFLAAMPTNLYGPGDNYDLEKSHVIPALIRKFHEAKTRGERTVIAWGSGRPRREFLYSDDLAVACTYLMNLPDAQFLSLLDAHRTPPLINIGCGSDQTIRELVSLVKDIIQFPGEVIWDAEKPDGTMLKLLDSSRIFKLGWRPQTSLTAGLGKAYEDFLLQTA